MSAFVGKKPRRGFRIAILVVMAVTQASFRLPDGFLGLDKRNDGIYQPAFSLSNQYPLTQQSIQETAPGAENPQWRRWALVWWRDNTITCNIFLEREGQPEFPEIETQCGKRILKAWKNTPLCLPENDTDTSTCKGLYLLDLGWVTADQIENLVKDEIVDTSAIQLTCTAEGVCQEALKFEFSVSFLAAVADPHEIRVEIDGEAVPCENQTCVVDIPVTDEEGVEVAYWAEKEDGSRAAEKSLRVRSLPADSDQTSYQVELLEEDVTGDTNLDACADIWDIIPDEATRDSSWMARGNDPDLLQTSDGFALLAGQLIRAGFVDASDCPNEGLLERGYADTCGNEKARELVLEWQNRSNPAILKAAQETGISPWLLKGLIAQETQFWPQWDIEGEFGYGMLTEKGMDMLLNWNIPYFLELCNNYYTPDDCAQGYSSLSENQQRFLRGACLLSIGTDDEFRLLAGMLQASCAQSNRLVKNVTRRDADDLFSYEEMWRFSLGVYNAGAGCMGDALGKAWSDKKNKIDWDAIQGQLSPACRTAGDYFDKVIAFSETR